MKPIDQNTGAASSALNDDFFPNGVSLDSFDEVAEPHEFSATYQARKAALLGEYRAQQVEAARNGQPPATIAPPQVQVRRKRKWGWKVAVVAAAAALVALPAAGFAVANNADFFANAFGTGARDSVAAHDETVSTSEKTYTVTYPAREYVDVDPEEAEALLGDHLMTTPIEVMAGDNKLTILSAVRDDNSAVVHYTVSREGGVTSLKFNELSNEAKGAFTPNDYPYFWQFTAPSADDAESGPNFAGSHIFVNASRSTADSIDCYEYLGFVRPINEGAPLYLEVVDREASWETAEKTEVPATNALASMAFAEAGGTQVNATPLSLRIDCANVTSRDEQGSLPYEVDSVQIALSDGSSYTVFDKQGNVDNTCYFVYDEGISHCVTVFNRLVNPESIASITVNGVEFTR